MMGFDVLALTLIYVIIIMNGQSLSSGFVMMKCCHQDDIKAYWRNDKLYNNNIKDSKVSIKTQKCGRYTWDKMIFWDMANISTVQISEIRLHQITCSKYYIEKSFKDGVFIQLFRWM